MYNIIIQSAFRGLLAYLLLLIVARFMERKLISQMTFFDFIVAVTLGSLGANLGMGKETSSQSAAAVIVTITLLTIITGYLHIRSFAFRKLVNSEPVAIIENGKINEQNMKKIRLTLQELTSLLREKNVFNIADVEFALMETDGKMSVQPKSQKQPITPSDLNLSTSYKGLTKDLIIDGRILEENLQSVNLDKNWLKTQLNNQGIQSVGQVFYAGLDSSGSLYISVKQPDTHEKHGQYGIE